MELKISLNFEKEELVKLPENSWRAILVSWSCFLWSGSSVRREKNLLLVINSQVLVTSISSIWSNLSRFKQFGKINRLISHKNHFVLQICSHCTTVFANVDIDWGNTVPLKNKIVGLNWFEADNYCQESSTYHILDRGIVFFPWKAVGFKVENTSEDFFKLKSVCLSL